MSNSWAGVVPASTRLAFVLTGNRERAATIGRRTFVRLHARLQDLRDPYAVEMWTRRTVVRLARRGRVVAPGGGGDDGRLWRSFLALRHKQRAALALRFLEKMDEEQIGDVLGCSAPGARAIVDRGLDALGPAAGANVDVEEELSSLFAMRADEIDVPFASPARAARRAHLGRAVGIGVLAAAVAVAGAGLYAGARVVVPEAAAEVSEGRSVEQEHFEVRPGPGEAPADLSPAGAPAWCPPRRKFEKVMIEDALDANIMAINYGVALAKRYEGPLERQSLRSKGAPGALKWPHPETPRFQVIQSTPAADDDALITSCGKATAESTWKVVIREAGHTRGDVVLALYLVRTGEDWRTWATMAGPSRG